MPGLGLTSPMLLVISLGIAAATCAVAWRRRAAAPVFTAVAVLLGLLSLTMAAGGLTWHRSGPGDVAVMVDLSASTRGAGYRNRTQLDRRIGQLLGGRPYRLIFFSQTNREMASPVVLEDLPGEHTEFKPPAAGAVVLFSDGRFELPAGAPPTYPVIDAMLDRPVDAAVVRMELRGSELAVATRNSGGPREMRVGGNKEEIPNGSSVTTRPVGEKEGEIVARLSAGDLWPENDTLTIASLPTWDSQRWWVGADAPHGNWRAMSAKQLPTEARAYLAPAVIVLNNVSAEGLSGLQMERLGQYVRDLGGAVVLLGGERAFAAGGYQGTMLETLSPLGSAPPQPTMRWMLLADSSGSMAAETNGRTRWQMAAEALVRLLPNLPHGDPVDVGNFAEKLNWWSRGKSASETMEMALPPTAATPRGPTNLEPALEQIADEADATTPSQLLVMTDAETRIENAGKLTERLRAGRIHLHLLAIGQGAGADELQKMAAATGGTVVRQMDPQQWAGSAVELMRGAMPRRLGRDPIDVRFREGILQGRSVLLWNRTWLKPQAAQLAEAQAAEGPIPLAARWQLGAGEVMGAAFAATAAEGERLAGLMARPPRDPSLHVTWESGAQLRVKVDAKRENEYRNGLGFGLELSGEDGKQSYPLRQVGPGSYEAVAPASGRPRIATVWCEGRAVDRFAVAGRYAAEFEDVGNDYGTLRELAARTGGEVIPPTWEKKIEFRAAGEEISMRSYLAMLGAVLIALGIARWRWA